MIGNKLKYYRKKFKITQVELAKKLDISKQYISEIENRDVNISVEMALKITNAFKKITKEKTGGKQEVALRVENLFYLK